MITKVYVHNTQNIIGRRAYFFDDLIWVGELVDLDDPPMVYFDSSQWTEIGEL